MDNTSFSLIKTKLQRPLVRSNLLPRQRLIDLLEEGRAAPLTLVSAAPGAGKTTLLSDWLAACPCPSAWLSLDAGDSDLSAFLNYFVAALRAICPDACPQTLAILQAPELPPVSVLAGLLANRLVAE